LKFLIRKEIFEINEFPATNVWNLFYFVDNYVYV